MPWIAAHHCLPDIDELVIVGLYDCDGVHHADVLAKWDCEAGEWVSDDGDYTWSRIPCGRGYFGLMWCPYQPAPIAVQQWWKRPAIARHGEMIGG